VAIAAGVWRTHNALQYFVGSWDPPLGVGLLLGGREPRKLDGWDFG
jgi:hypothetical protein